MLRLARTIGNGGQRYLFEDPPMSLHNDTRYVPQVLVTRMCLEGCDAGGFDANVTSGCKDI
jgi:hypothetical protein